MFRTFRYFALFSAIAIALASVIVPVLYRRDATAELVKAVEQQNVAMSMLFANALAPHHADFIFAPPPADAVLLRRGTEIEALDEEVKGLAQGLPVLKVKIYNPGGVTIYSTDRADIGVSKSDNEGFHLAARLGLPASAFSTKDRVTAFSGIAYNRDVVETYVPVRLGDRTAVLELYADVTPRSAYIEGSARALAITLALLGVLYGVSFIMFRRGERLLRREYDILADREAGIAARNVSLEREIWERKRAEAALARAERLATLGQLTATVSHELRNPLGAMRSSTFFLRNTVGNASEDVARTIERLDRNITRCDRLIDELLDYTRMRVVEPAPTSLDSWLGEVLDEQALPENVTVEFNGGLPGTMVDVDSDLLRRAIINVTENGLQAITERPQAEGQGGRGHLRVSTSRAGGRLEIEIADTGHGIPEDVLPHIFEPMFSTRGFGVGLGLTVVKKVMEQHGGGVEVRSAPGVGTTVVLWLPEIQSSAAGAA